MENIYVGLDGHVYIRLYGTIVWRSSERVNQDVIDVLQSKRIRKVGQMHEKVKADLVREDGRLERLCEHGIGHPVGHVRGWMKKWETVHGCDGCCFEWATQEVRETPPGESEGTK